jgi:hypothetical protein
MDLDEAWDEALGDNPRDQLQSSNAQPWKYNIDLG